MQGKRSFFRVATKRKLLINLLRNNNLRLNKMVIITPLQGARIARGAFSHKRKSPARPGRTGLWKRRLAARYFPALLSAVSSPRGLLTAVFGMGTGVSAQQGPPTKGFRQENTRKASHVRQGANARARLLQRSPPRARICGRRGGGQRTSLTAYQNPSAERVATLAPGACQPGSLPGAFRTCVGDGQSPGRLGA